MVAKQKLFSEKGALYLEKALKKAKQSKGAEQFPFAFGVKKPAKESIFVLDKDNSIPVDKLYQEIKKDKELKQFGAGMASVRGKTLELQLIKNKNVRKQHVKDFLKENKLVVSKLKLLAADGTEMEPDADDQPQDDAGAVQKKMKAPKARWDKAKKEFRRDVDKVVDAVANSLGDDASAVVDALEDVLDINGLFADLSDAMEGVTSGKNLKAVTDLMKEYQTKLKDPLIQHLQKHPSVKVDLQKTVLEGLKDVAKELQKLKA